MQKDSVQERISDLMASRLGWAKPGERFSYLPSMPFDISRPNFHDSKAEFEAEYALVKEVVSHLEGSLRAFVEKEGDEKDAHLERVTRIAVAIEVQAVDLLPRNPPKSASALARRNVLTSGFFYTMRRLQFDLLRAYSNRLKDLDDQREAFWSVAHRPPNYYARTIALRFARFYARQTGQLPTVGTSSEGSHPSTDYGRILEELFSILKIDANIRGPAFWAVSQITEEDMKPEDQTGRFGLFGLGPPDPDDDALQSDELTPTPDEIVRKGSDDKDL